MSEIKVNSIKGVGASSAAITVNNSDGTCTANLTNRTNKNLILNGACLVSQRATSSTTNGYSTVDRFKTVHSGTDEAPTYAQVDVASGTTPYTLGFRKAYKFENGNQTSGAGAGDLIKMLHRVEAQDIANSGWNYLSSSSYLTMSFWVKSSVAQNFYIQLIAYDNATYNYTFETGSLTADTWTKVTHSIPGNSNIRFDNDNGLGLEINWIQFGGTDRTASDFALNTWAAYASSSQSPDMTSTWYTTNNATFELTGVQLEVGSVATDFEHRSFAQELQLCKRYYNKVFDAEGQSGELPASLAVYETNSAVTTTFNFPKMRAVPSLDITNGTNKFMVRSNSVSDHFDTMTLRYGTTQTAEIVASSGVSGTSGYGGFLRGADADVFIAFSAEL